MPRSCAIIPVSCARILRHVSPTPATCCDRKKFIRARREMRFLANENFPGDAVAALRGLGHDCLWVRTESPGLEDDAVIAWAERESLVVLTFDKDFGELAWRAALPATCGIVLFRLPMPPPGMVGAVLAKRLGERDD